MTDEPPSTASQSKRRVDRRPPLGVRVRNVLRVVGDRVLGADVAWSSAFVVLLMLLIASRQCSTIHERYEPGDIASEQIVAKFDFDVEDVEATARAREEARRQAPVVYVHDTTAESRLVSRLAEALRTEAPKLAAEAGKEADDVALTISEVATAALSRAMRGRVVGNKSLLESEGDVLLMRAPSGAEERVDGFRSFVDLRSARDRVAAEVERGLDLPPETERRLAELVAAYVAPNVAFDPNETSRRREAAASAVTPVRQRVPRGTTLVGEGDVIDAERADLLEAHRASRQGRIDVPEFFALFLVVTLLAAFLYRYCHYHQRHFRKLEHLHALLVLLVLFSLSLTRAIAWVAEGVAARLPAPFDRPEAYLYLSPIGAGAILVGLLANGRIAITYAAFTAVLFGMLDAFSLPSALWALLVQLSGIYAVTAYRARSTLLRAGFVVGLMGGVTAFGLEVLKRGTEPIGEIAVDSGIAFVGGALGTGLVVSFSLPILEGLFNVLTDIRLLELSNVEQPLLSQLAVKAPGSYNHSLVVGTLAEDAAKAIGANSLFCRVAAVYHDVGKMVKPEYFVENQSGFNPHDRLTPSMSALVIASHVKDGIRLARQAGVPEQIVDIVPQHHGTRLMTYFHEKAKKNADPSVDRVNEQDFRYPGPKPQTREAAIFMLSDAIEAAARTVEDPTPNRLREMIRKVSGVIVLDGQLDECDLTFADLDRIHSSFLRTLVSMYHHRVDYPGFDFGKGRGGASKAGNGRGGAREGKQPGTAPSDKATGEVGGGVGT